MNRRMVIFLLSRILLVEGILMLPSVLVGIIYREAITWCFLPSIGALGPSPCLKSLLCGLHSQKASSLGLAQPNVKAPRVQPSGKKSVFH